MTKSKSQIPNSEAQADLELERDDMGDEGLREVVETDGTGSRGPGRLDARLKGVRRRKRARHGAGSEVLASKLRMVEAESDGCEE